MTTTVTMKEYVPVTGKKAGILRAPVSWKTERIPSCDLMRNTLNATIWLAAYVDLIFFPFTQGYINYEGYRFV